jgi:putative spermidine/putrescine transport system permease protein
LADKTLPVAIYSFLKSGITTAVSTVAALVSVPVLLGAVILGARAVLKARSTTMRTQS